MKYTREQITEMNEAQLRTIVLKPLFEKMGFRDVFIYHGGAGEQGKDFVMWKSGDLGERINFAVVAKATRITGQANPVKGSAGEVAIQVQQAFGHDFLDSVTLEQQRVNTCWIVSSGDISKEAEQSIKSVLGTSHLDRNVRFVSGDLLWEMVRKHFPEAGVMEQARQVAEAFENLDPDWRFAFSTKGGVPNFQIEPKQPGKAVKPLPFKFKVRFPNDDDGRSKLQEFKAAIEKGTPISIGAPFLVEAEVPEPFKKIFDGEISKIEFDPVAESATLPTTFKVESSDGSEFVLANVELRVERHGTVEAVTSNRHQNLPWLFQIKGRLAEKSMTFSWAIDIGNTSAHKMLNALKLWEAFTKPGKLTVVASDTGFLLFEIPLELCHPLPDAPDPWFLEFASDLDFVQRATGKEYKLPKRNLNGEDLAQVKRMAEFLRVGRIKTKGLKFTNKYSRSDLATMLETIGSNEGKRLTICGANFIDSVLDQTVPIGLVALDMHSVRIESSCLQNLSMQMANLGDEYFEVAFETVGDSVAEFFCLNRIPKDVLPPEIRQIVDEFSVRTPDSNK